VARALLLVMMCALLVACGSNIRRDWGGGGSNADVAILPDVPAVERAVWEGTVVYDLRHYDAWAQGHIPGARRLELDDLRRGRALPPDRHVPILFMGEGPLDLKPELAAEYAIEQGYSNVQLFPGGWRAWIGAHPIR
jgi:rhodanese-related sulfurtransferase